MAQDEAVSDLDGGTGTLCFSDANLFNLIDLSITSATGKTPDLVTAAFPTVAAAQALFEGSAPTALYDGTTVSLSALSSPLAFDTTASIFFQDANGRTLGRVGTARPTGGVGTATLVLTP